MARIASVFAVASALIMGIPAHAERGAHGQVNILYWQAPSNLNPYLSAGAKDVEAAGLMLEPLARYDESGQMIPWLARAIPTLENGGISADLTRITWQLRDGLTWSDGSPVTAQDVQFTHAYCTAPEGGCSQRDKFRDVVSVTATGTQSVVVEFARPKPFPYNPFVGAQSPILQRAQFSDCMGARAPTCAEANFAPIGTGPFVVDEFRPGDVAVFSANPNYRIPDRPGFARAVIKGGGGATSAARAVLETGEFDYAWNLQLAPEVLHDMQQGGQGVVVTAFGTLVERLAINFTDPDPDLGETRATRAHPHPILADPAVRRALSMAIDRALLVEVGYGVSGRPSCNIVPAPAIHASRANETCLQQDIAAANALLESAGWVDSDGDTIRERDGQQLRLLLQTSTNAVRQDFQAMLKHWWAQIGIDTELRNIEPSVFFGGDAASPDTMQRFYADLELYAGNFDGTDPESYLAGWACDQAPTPQNQWQGPNVGRWCDPAYEALIAKLAVTGGEDARAAIARAMNDMLVQDGVILPLVDRGRVSAHANSLGGVRINAWDSELWNIADWYRRGE